MAASNKLRVTPSHSMQPTIGLHRNRATALHLAVLVARSQLPDHRMRAQGRQGDLGRSWCSQRRWSGLWSAQLHGESVPAIAERPASKPEPPLCIWLC